MEDRIRMQVLKTAVAPPQPRRLGHRRRPIAQRAGTPRLRLIAQSKFTGPAQAAMATRQILFERDTIAFAQPPSPRRNRPQAINPPDIFMPHDARGTVRLVGLPIAPANSRGFDFEDAGVGRDLGKRILADLGFKSAERSCGEYGQKISGKWTRRTCISQNVPERTRVIRLDWVVPAHHEIIPVIFTHPDGKPTSRTVEPLPRQRLFRRSRRRPGVERLGRRLLQHPFSDRKNSGAHRRSNTATETEVGFRISRRESVWGQPAIAAGRVFVGVDNGFVYALDAAGGCVYWSFEAAAACAPPSRSIASTKSPRLVRRSESQRLCRECRDGRADLESQCGRSSLGAPYRNA